MNKIQIFILLILTLFSINSIAAEDNFNFLSFYIDDDSQTNKVSYEIRKSDEFQEGDKFKLETYYNDKLIDDQCVKELDLSEGVLFTKFVCDVDKLGEGEYTFVGKIIRGNDDIKLDLTRHYIFENLQAKITAEIKENKTIIYVDVLGDGENILVKNRIPKEAIESLTKKNKDELISAEFEYDILEEDPLIAWSVDKAPQRINYTINKRLDSNDISKFQVQLEKDNNYLKYSNYFLIIVIVIIIGLVFKPLLVKLKK